MPTLDPPQSLDTGIDYQDLETRLVAQQLQDLQGQGLFPHGIPWDAVFGKDAAPNGPKKGPVDATRVLAALSQHPALLYEVATTLGATRAHILGPWSDPETKEQGSKSRICRVNMVRRFDTQGKFKSFVGSLFRREGDSAVLESIEWQVLIKCPSPSGRVQLYGKGTANTVTEAQTAADDYAREAGWMLVD
jgi:hypothetical protein